MKVSQQIVGVNQRLGNTAVPNMQGTTRLIFDTAIISGAGTDQTVTYFAGVSSRPYPLSNISQNKFEVGESLAIQGFSLQVYEANPTIGASLFGLTQTTNSAILNFYIGNQRVVKDLEIARYGQMGIGETNDPTRLITIFRMETPIVIPPQIEFYATVRYGFTGTQDTLRYVFSAFGTGTLLNPKSPF